MKMNIYIPAVAVAVAAAVTGCSSHGKSASEGGDAVLKVDVAQAVVDSVVLHKSYPGYLDASSQVQVVGRVNGQLLGSRFNGGDNVVKGQVLFSIEDTKYRDAVTQARAQLATAKSSRDYASSHYQAVKKALESDAVSQMEVIQAESAYKQAEAAVNNAEAALQTAMTQLSYCTVTAPVGGTISAGAFSDGTYINGEGSPVVLATIYNNSNLNVVFNIEDEQYIEMLADASRDVKADLSRVPLNFSEKLPHSYYGELQYVAPTIDRSTGTMLLKCNVDNPYGELRNGMYVTVDLPYKVEPEAVLVKDASIGTDQLGRYLYVVNDADEVVYTPVTVGELVNDSMRVVSKGVEAGTRYVTRAMLKVRNGMHVDPVESL